MGHIYTNTRDATSAPHPDGFNGARDAAILFDYMDEDTAADGIVYVQSCQRTDDLLRRSGIMKRQRHGFYPVRVVTDRFKRLQAASARPADSGAGAEVARAPHGGPLAPGSTEPADDLRLQCRANDLGGLQDQP